MMSNITKGFTKLKNDGPWGSYNGGGNSGNNDKKGNKNNDNDIDELLKASREFLRGIFDNGSGGGKPKSPNNSKNKPPVKSLFSIIILALVVLWLASGLYKVNSDENAVVLYFGKFHSIATPGLNYRLPAPFGKVIKKSVITVNTEEFISGVSDNVVNRNKRMFSNVTRSTASDNLMLTGDENIVDIDFQIQWQISDIKDFTFNIEDPYVAIRKATESAMREIIAKTPITDALSDGKRRIEQEAKQLLQNILDSYQSGVRIVLIQMRRVDPPKQVIDSFRDVQTARADKEKTINQAEAYKNDITPRARGTAVQLTQQAEAYEKQVIADAQGQASRFLAVYYQYARAKTVTRKRIYLETMEKLYKDMDKIIIDNTVAKSGVVPYLPINELKKINK